MKLEIELIPKTTHFTNVRSMVPAEQWDVLRKNCYTQAGHRCEICGGKGEKWPVECHEVWDYNFKTKTQKLIRLIALCPSCHEVKHMGLAQVRGRREIAKYHLMRVNQISNDDAEQAIEHAFEDWHEKNQINWKLDISHIEKCSPVKTDKEK